jgi:hypothetical protein
MVKSRVRVEMAVQWWVCVLEPDLVVESSLFLHCTGCVEVLVTMLLVYEL